MFLAYLIVFRLECCLGGCFFTILDILFACCRVLPRHTIVVAIAAKQNNPTKQDNSIQHYLSNDVTYQLSFSQHNQTRIIL